jgi:hypothetical protein
VGSGRIQAACCLWDGIWPPAMVALSGGMQAPCSNGSQWRFVEEVQVEHQQGYEPVATTPGQRPALGWHSSKLLGGAAVTGQWCSTQEETSCSWATLDRYIF